MYIVTVSNSQQKGENARTLSIQINCNEDKKHDQLDKYCHSIEIELCMLIAQR